MPTQVPTRNEAGEIADMQRILRQIASLPESDARGLPGAFYTSPDFFRYEAENFLAKEWHCLGRADEIPEPGDYFTTKLFYEPLLVIRGDDGEIRVLTNICRHRGMPLAEGSGKARRLICSYHAWTYGRDGALASAPRMKERGVSGENCRLPAFRSEIWNGFIYANLDDDAAPLAPRLTELGALLQNYRTEEMRHVYTMEEEWHCNWKCLVENFMEAYHLSIVHPQTLHPYTPTSLSRKAADGEAFTSYCANYPDSAAGRGAGAPGLSDAERRCSTLFCVYPLQIVSQAATLLVSLSIQPLTVDRIRVRWTMSTYGDQLTPAELESRRDLWNEVNGEDRVKLEKLQKVLSSRHAPSGPLAPRDFEGTIWDFYRYLGSKLPAEPVQLSVARG